MPRPSGTTWRAGATAGASTLERRGGSLMTEQPKFCRDCRWVEYWYSESSGQHEACLAPQNLLRHLVDGKMYPRHSKCSDHRHGRLETEHTCGEEGRWFEPKPPRVPFWARVFGP